MKILALNGSPRKNRNTAILIKNTMEGAFSMGAETELIHLYDLNYKGCMSCFSCKLKNGKSYGKCALSDDLTPILIKIPECDALILGSPVYLGSITGEMKSFLERLIFPYLVYDKNYSSLFKKKLPSVFIYTFGAEVNRMKEIGYDQYPMMIGKFFEMFFGPAVTFFVNDTYQFDDYSKYESSRFDPTKKAKRREEVFPLDCKKAFELGVRLVETSNQ